MHDPEEVYHLLNIAHLSHNWQDLWPLRDRALNKLRQIAHEHEVAEKQSEPVKLRPLAKEK